jgi:hypothetical protein
MTCVQMDRGTLSNEQVVAALFRQIGLTQKYLASKAGKDVSEMTLKTTITERPKKRKSRQKASLKIAVHNPAGMLSKPA